MEKLTSTQQVLVESVTRLVDLYTKAWNKSNFELALRIQQEISSTARLYDMEQMEIDEALDVMIKNK